MSVFREHLQNTYASSPEKVGDFVSSSFVFVRIRQRFWRGYRKASDASVAVDGVTVDGDKGAMTMPSWKLAPRELVEEFQSFATGVEQAVRRHAFSPKESGDDQTTSGAASAVLVGGGRHMVDVSVWPQLRDYLYGVGGKWSEAADRWCTEDGYQLLHAHVGEQYGKEIYDRISGLIPERNKLRTRFGLDVRTAPVKIVEEASTDDSAKAGRRDEIVDLLDLAIRVPREEVAETWESAADRLAVPDGSGGLTAVKIVREGDKKDTSRNIQVKTVRSIRNHTLMLGRSERYLDPELKRLRDAVLREFPSDDAAVKAAARALSTDDDEAVRVGGILRSACAAARNELGMCEGLTSATGVIV